MDKLKCRIVKWLNRRMTFADVAIVAEASNVSMRSLVSLHPSFHVAEEIERIAA